MEIIRFMVWFIVGFCATTALILLLRIIVDCVNCLYYKFIDRD